MIHLPRCPVTCTLICLVGFALFLSQGCTHNPVQPMDDIALWEYRTNGWIAYCPAIGDDGTIYVSSRDAYLYALDPKGPLKWRFLTRQALQSPPVIAPDGSIYVISEDEHLYSIRPDGTLRWRVPTGGTFESHPAVDADGTVYYCSTEGFLRAIGQNGDQLWQLALDSGWRCSPAIDSAGRIYITDYTGFPVQQSRLLAVDPLGSVLWEFPFPRSTGTSPVIARDGRIIVTCDTTVYAINRDGTLGWNYEVPGVDIMGMDRFSEPVVDPDGTIYVSIRPEWSGRPEGGIPPYHVSRFYAFRPDGSVTWVKDLEGVILTSPVLGRSGSLYAIVTSGGCYGAQLQSFNSQGSLRWRYAMGEGCWLGSPIVTREGRILVGSEQSLFALRAGGDRAETGSWSSFRGNLRNSGTSMLP